MLTGVSGFLNLLSIFIHKEPIVLEVEQWLPFAITEGSRVSLIGAGLVQILLIRGIWRGKHEAWRLACLTLLVAPWLHLGFALQWQHVPVSLALLCAFLVYRGHFVARSDFPSIRWAFVIAAAALVVLEIAGVSALRHFKKEITGRQTFEADVQTVLELAFLQSTDTQFPKTEHAQTVFVTIEVAALCMGGVVLTMILRPVVIRPEVAYEEIGMLRRLIDKYGNDPLNEFSFLPDKHLFFHGGGENLSVVVYALWRDVAVTLTDPIGPKENRETVIEAFTRFCVEQDWHPVFYEVSAETLELYHKTGFSTFKVAEDARIRLADFTLQGGKFQNLRTALNKARKTGTTFLWYDGAKIDLKMEAQMQAISNEWLQSKNGMEMTFDMGAFSIARIRNYGASLAIDAAGKVEAFSTWMPYGQGKGRCLDLMRCRLEARGTMMDFLIVSSIEYFRAKGIEEVSLGNAPLANIENDMNRLVPEEKAIRYLFENFKRLYGYKSLFDFKKKYNPQWQGRYVAYAGIHDLPGVVMAVVRLHIPRGLWKLIRS